MTLSTNNRKFQIIQQIISLNSETELQEIEAHLAKKSKQFQEIVTPLDEEISVSQLKKEQNYQPISLEEFNTLAQKVQIEEPLADLLSMLD